MAHRPFDKVPPEILSHILTFAWLSDMKDDSLRRYRFPSITNQVDRYFNRTTVDTPILWSYLRVTNVSDLPHIQDRILNKSGALPLDVYVVFAGVQYQDARIMVEGTILCSPARCRAITLSYRTAQPILNARPLDMDSLKRFWDRLQPLVTHQPPLQVVSFSMLNQSAFTGPFDLLPQFSPSLRLLHLADCNFTWPPSFPRTLEVIAIHDDETINAAQIHRCFGGPIHHSLVSLSLKGLILEYDKHFDPHTFARLEHLELVTFNLNEVMIIFSIIHAPNIHHLSLKSIFNESLTHQLSPIWEALQFPKLNKLTFRNIQIDSHHQIEFLQRLPYSVNCLKISNNSEGLLYDSSISTLCSQLHEVVTYDIPLRFLSSWVEERCPSLRKLEARFNDDSNIDRGLTRDQLSLLKAMVTDFKIWMEATDPGVDEPYCLSLDQVLAVDSDNV